MVDSRLTCERPDIWTRGLALATGVTGYLYLPKLPAADGTIFACGGPFAPPKINPLVGRQDAVCSTCGHTYEHHATGYCSAVDGSQRIGYRSCHCTRHWTHDDGRSGAPTTSSVLVPDGAMEWLLHEVGHWIAATPEERLRPNYGNGHELEAWAFEEIILDPFGPARGFAPVTQRDGTAFDLAGPIPSWAFRHIDRQIHADRIAIEQFRALWGEWVQWGTVLGPRAPWKE